MRPQAIQPTDTPNAVVPVTAKERDLMTAWLKKRGIAASKRQFNRCHKSPVKGILILAAVCVWIAGLTVARCSESPSPARAGAVLHAAHTTQSTAISIRMDPFWGPLVTVHARGPFRLWTSPDLRRWFLLETVLVRYGNEPQFVNPDWLRDGVGFFTVEEI